MLLLVTQDLLSVKRNVRSSTNSKLRIIKTLYIDPVQLSQEGSLNKLSKEIQHKANGKNQRKKILSSNRNQKIQLLTLVPIF